jgi:hypothetical protein
VAEWSRRGLAAGVAGAGCTLRLDPALYGVTGIAKSRSCRQLRPRSSCREACAASRGTQRNNQKAVSVSGWVPRVGGVISSEREAYLLKRSVFACFSSSSSVSKLLTYLPSVRVILDHVEVTRQGRREAPPGADRPRVGNLVIPPQQEVPILNHVARRLGWGWERRRWWALDGRYGDVKRERRCEC